MLAATSSAMIGSSRCSAGDRHRRDEDQRALDPGGKVIGLLVPIGMLLVRRPLGPLQDHKAENRSNQIDDGLRGVRQQAHRSRQRPRTVADRVGG